MSAQENVPQQETPSVPEGRIDREEAPEMAERINAISGAQMKALELMPDLADRDNVARAKRWGRTVVMMLSLTALKSLGGGVEPAQAGQESYSRTKARAQDVVYDVERGVQDELYQRELKDIEMMRNAADAYERLVGKLGELNDDLDLLNRRFRTLAREKVKALLELQKVEHATDYALAVEAYTDAVTELQFLEQSFRLVPIDIEAPDYHARVARFQDAKKRVEALSTQLQVMDESTLGFDPAYPPYEVSRFLDVHDEMQQVIPEMRALDAARARAEELLEERERELEKMGKEVKGRSRTRDILGIGVGIGGAILKDKLDPWKR